MTRDGLVKVQVDYRLVGAYSEAKGFDFSSVWNPTIFVLVMVSLGCSNIFSRNSN